MYLLLGDTISINQYVLLIAHAWLMAMVLLLNAAICIYSEAAVLCCGLDIAVASSLEAADDIAYGCLWHCLIPLCLQLRIAAAAAQHVHVPLEPFFLVFFLISRQYFKKRKEKKFNFP